MTKYSIPLFSSLAMNSMCDISAAFQQVLSSHRYILGEEVFAFEHEFGQYCGVSECITLANGTDALELALRAIGISRGDKVALVANAGFYGSAAILLLQANPIYIDIDPVHLTMSVSHLKDVIRIEKPKAIIVTHLYGQLADIEEIIELANHAGISVIEDCAQAHGATRNGKRAGSFGTIGCFSFYPTKNLGALGDGGAVVTNHKALANTLRQLRQYGWSQKYYVGLHGGRNSRLDEIQAAILRLKLPYLDEWNHERRRIAMQYNDAFSGFSMNCPRIIGNDYVGHLYVIRIQDRIKFREYLRSHGITTEIHYPIPDHKQMIQQLNIRLPMTEMACESVVSLPCFPGLSSIDIKRVITCIQRWFQSSPTSPYLSQSFNSTVN